MSEPIPAVFETYLAMWNEPDLDALMPYVERVDGFFTPATPPFDS